MSGVKARPEKSSGFNHTRTIIVEQKEDGTFILPNNMIEYQGLDSGVNEVCVLVEGEEIITDETLCESSAVVKIEQEELEYEETAEASENSQDAESLETELQTNETERVVVESDMLGLEEDPIGLGQNKRNPSDEDLKPLAWLQDKNLLKTMKMTTPAQPSQQAMRKPPQHFLKAASITPPKVASKYIKVDVPIVVSSVPMRKESVNESSSQSSEVSAEEDNEEDAELLAYAKQLQAEVQRSLEIEKDQEIDTSAISNTVTYDPNVHTHVKPPHSFSCLIFMAIEESPNKALPVKEIYNWMADKFPYFRHASAGWKNSVRHNLSLNKCFRKVDRLNMGKGSLWTVDPAFRPSLLAALCKTPTATGQYESKPTTPARYAKLGPDTVIKMPPKVHLPTSSRTYSKYAGRSSSSSSLSDGGHRGRPRFAPSDSSSPKDPLAKSNVPDPNLFPFLSKRLAGSEANGARKRRADVDAAAAMLALAKGESGVKEGEIYIDGRPVKVKFVVERSSDGTAMLSAAEKKRNKIAESFSPDFLRCHDYAGTQEVFEDSPDESEDYQLEDPEFIVVANEIEVGTQIELETEEMQLPTNPMRRSADGREGRDARRGSR